MICELNKDVGMLRDEDSIEKITRGWWMGTNCKYENIREKERDWRDVNTPGGAALITNGKATSHIRKQGGDTRGLGRWRWNIVQGKHGVRTMMISVYRPGASWATARNQLVHLRRTEEGRKDMMEPMQLWEDDFKALVRSKQEAGCNVIMGGDFNDNIMNERGVIRRIANELGLVEAIISKYGGEDGEAIPQTFEYGSTPIDGAFISEGMMVKQGGYTTFEDSPSDHRWWWLDIDERSIIGDSCEDRARPMERKATSKIPSVKERFNFELNRQIHIHKMKSKVDDLYDRCIKSMESRGEISNDEKRETEQLNDRLMRSIKAADSKCRKSRTGKVPFSDKAKEIMGALNTLRTMKCRCLLRGKPNRPRQRRIERLAAKAKYKGDIKEQDLEQIKLRIKEKEKEYSEFRPKAHEFRETYLGRIADELSKEDGKDAEMHLRNLMMMEEMREKFKKIKRAEGRTQGGGVDAVEREEEGGRVLITDRTEIELEIMRVNANKLLQAKNTPLRMEPLQSLLGEQGDFSIWERILKNEVVLPEGGIEESTRLWFDFVSNGNIEELEIEWTAQEYFDSWKKMKENTGSAPGIHFGHMKCIDPTSDAAEVVSKLALLPLKTGYAPKHWKTGINTMIPKKVDDLRPEKLRLILLMDCRFNHNNKLIGKRMMEYGEKKGLMAEEQYGSRKAKSAILHALNKRLSTDYIRQYKIPAVYCANDAKACYDRILHLVAYLTMRMFGIPKEAAICSIVGLMEMEHHIRTVYGDSDEYYGGTKWQEEHQMNPHGNGQGNGNGPSLWAAISSPLLYILRSEGYGISFKSPMSMIAFRLAAFGFVDDMDYIQANEDCDSDNETLEEAKKGLNLWEGLLRTTGGAIEPTKSDWVRIGFEKVRGTWKFKKMNEDDEMKVRDTSGEEYPLEQLPVGTARLTLGVWQAVTGDETKEVDHLKEKIMHWKKKVWTSRLSQEEARCAVSTTIGKTLDYPLPATALTTKQCEEVTKEFLKVALPKSGIVRSAARDIVHTPEDILGFGFKDMETKQSIEHVMVMLDHGSRKTVTGRLLRILAEGTLVEIGMEGDLLAMPMASITWAEATWMTNTIEGIARMKIGVENVLPMLSKWKANDRFIMDEIFNSKVFSPQEMNQINEARLRLQVTTLSDVTTADGRRIKEAILQGQEGTSCSSKAYSWPRSIKLTTTEIYIWSKALRVIFTNGINNEVKRDMVTNIWTKEAKTHTEWWYDPDTTEAYKREDNEYKQWGKTHNTGRRTRRTTNGYSFSGQTTLQLPNGCVPITVLVTGDRMEITGQGMLEERNEEQEEEEATDIWSKHGWPTRQIILPSDNGYQYAMEVGEGQGKIVCDGSFKNGRSSAAFNTITAEQVKGANIVPGRKQDQTAYRAELGGILGAVITTKEICKQNDIERGATVIGCDCEGAIKALWGDREPTCRWNSYDILSRIKEEMDDSNIEFSFRHIKGHQDDDKEEEDLDEWEKANVQADKEAKAYLRVYVRSGCPRITDNLRRSDRWKLKIDGEHVVTDVSKALYDACWKHKGQAFWYRRWRIQDDQQGDVDWKVFESTQKLSSGAKRKWRTKHMANIGPVATVLHMRKERDSEQCPRCEEVETNLHIIQCKGDGTDEVFEEGMEEVHEWIGEMKQDTRNAIKELIAAYREQREINMEDIRDDSVKEAAIKQWEMGQHLFMWGVLHKGWDAIITNNLRGTRRSSTKWLAILCNKIWMITEGMWFHRNDKEHPGKDTNALSEERNRAANERIDTIYGRIPRNLRLLPLVDRVLFRQTKARMQKRKLRYKKRWIRDAEKVLDGYDEVGIRVPEARRFREYFMQERRNEGQEGSGT